jgi:predicted nucleic acid-binding protein
MYLLDTNVVSELRRPKPHGAVLAWISGVAEEDLHLSAVTLGELQAGVEITRNLAAEKAREIEIWVDDLAESFNVLPLDDQAFRIWARLPHKRERELLLDAMIAATAILHGLTVVTRNIKDFRHFGVPMLNPFSPN